MSAPPPTWHALGGTPPASLTDARLQLHHAAQAVSAVGLTLLPPAPDDSHPNLGWSPALAALAGHPVPAAASCQAALDLAGLRLRVADAGGVGDALPLAGRTLDEAHAWLAEALARRGARPPADGLRRTPYDLPDHPVAHGAPFSQEPAEAFAELARWFANADAALEALAGATEDASPVRCWPHHFDVATLVAVARDADGAAVKTVGIGMTPGDGSYAEPYWYVTPWPYPASDRLAPLESGGHWHTEGYAAAILTGSEWLGDGRDPAEQQRARLQRFLDESFATSRRALED